jgi:hypothetical protein
LIYVRGSSTVDKLTINAGAVLQNNDRTGTDYFGGAVECSGSFEMNGGAITRNRTSGFGGGVYFRKNYTYARAINGGSINNNDAGLSGGGFMLDLAGECRITMTGGEIRENRARGKEGDGNLVNANCDGFGGGVFIPGPSISLPISHSSEFIMSGGVILNNISASGLGNGVVIDRKWTPVPRFVMTSQARIVNNDVYLSRTNSSMNDCTIEIGGTLLNSPAAEITVNSAFYPAAPGPGIKVLSGDLTQYAKFVSGLSPGYSIHDDGKIRKD